MNKSATANSVTIPTPGAKMRIRRVNTYTTLVTVLGLVILIHAMNHVPKDFAGLGWFILLAVIAELTSVELFQNSRSWVSMSSIIAIASIVALGPLAGVITYLASGMTTALTTTIQNSRKDKSRVSLFQRTSFNAGMWSIAAFLAGSVYMLVGGEPGAVAQYTNILPLVMAVTIEWVINAILLIGVISIQTDQRPVEIWNRDIRWQAPVSIIGGVLGSGILAIAYSQLGMFGVLIVLLPILSTSYAFRLYKSNMKEYVNGLERLNVELKEALVDLEAANKGLTDANTSIRRLNAELFQSLARVFDMRDPYVGGHAAQVATYAVAIATEMGLPGEKIEVVRQAAFLHDIGKLAIPEAILHKPGKLTEIEYEFIKKHTDIGADLLASTEGLKHLAPFVRFHHERWDGYGYPQGLDGEEIPLEARILNVCDSVESMASDRPYHRGMSIAEIKAEVERCSAFQFDPAVVDVFIRLLNRHGNSFITNSARSVTQQYAASLLANESLTHNMFAWVLEKDALKQPVRLENPPTHS